MVTAPDARTCLRSPVTSIEEIGALIILSEDTIWQMRPETGEVVDTLAGIVDVVHVTAGASGIAVADRAGAISLLGRGSGRVEPLAERLPGLVTSILIFGEEPAELLVGTEPPHVYRVTEGNCVAVRSFDELECRPQWYTPWGGPAAVRSFARGDDGWVYADIHVGSIMRSPDRGHTWEPVTPDLHEDVHQVAVSPSLGHRVVADTARAVYVSDDRGESWQYRGEGLGDRYGRAVAMHPQNADCFLATVSDGPHGENVHAQLVHTVDTGRTWSLAGGEFPESVRGNIDTFHIAYSADGQAWAAVRTDLYNSADTGRTWTRCWRAPNPIRILSCEPLGSIATA